MSKVVILLFVFLSRFAIATDAVNPVSKFLMNRHGGGDDAALVEQVKVAEESRDQAMRDTQAASAGLASLQQDMEELKKDNEVRIQQMSQSSDAAVQIAQVQEQANARIEEVKARADKESEEAKEASVKSEAELIARYDQDYSEFTNALNEREAELKSQHERALTEAANEHAQKVAELTSIIEKEGEMVASTAEKDTELAEANEALAKKNEELTTRIQELEALWQDSKQKIESSKEEVRVQLKQEMDDMIAKHSKEITALEGRLSPLEQERNKLQQLSVDQERKTSEMQEESRQALNTALAEHEKEVEALQGKVATAAAARKASEKEQMRSIAALNNDLVNFKQDLKYWEGLFGERSYCNFTHMQVDTVDAIQTAERATTLKLKQSLQWFQEMTHSASELAKTTFAHSVTIKDDSVASAKRNLLKASEAVDPYKKKANVLYDQHLKVHVDASTEKVNVLYDRHLKEHVEKVRPHYEKHVVPPVEKTRAAVVQVVDVTNKSCTTAYAGVVTYFEVTCHKILSFCVDLREKKGIEVPGVVMKSLKHGCSEPEEVVSTFFTATLVLLAFLFRVTLWRQFVGIVSFALKIAWFFTPLRFFVKSSKSASKSDANGADSSATLGQ